jgi:hypothetical protein
MEKNLLQKWLDEDSIDTEGLPKTWAEASTTMREAYKPLDAMNITELETFANDGKNKAFIALYAKCLLNARQTGKYAEVNHLRKKIGMNVLEEA